jgi:hypothetical protein
LSVWISANTPKAGEEWEPTPLPELSEIAPPPKESPPIPEGFKESIWKRARRWFIDRDDYVRITLLSHASNKLLYSIFARVFRYKSERGAHKSECS